MLLYNGCSCSTPNVHPANWRSGGASSLKKDWYIQYWFRDPSQPPDWQKKYPYGKLFIVKGMNDAKTLEERRALTKVLLEHELRMLRSGYNPIEKKNVAPAQMRGYEVEPDTPLPFALGIALDRIKTQNKADLRSVVKYTRQAITALGYDSLPIGSVKRKHIKFILERLGSIKKLWTSNTYNYYRAHLSMLFTELVEYEAVDYNPVRDISKMKTTQKIRETLSREERRRVDLHLRKKKLTRFRLYIRLFFHSGIRNTEMLLIKGKHVNLKDQLVRVTIKKGRQIAEVDKTIKSIAIRYWQLALKNCGPDDYVFSRHLKPGPVPISADQITRRWEVHVKELQKKPEDRVLNITSDFYALKHGNTTEMVDILGEETAAELNSHRGTGMVRKIYDTKRFSRQHDRIKKAGNEF